MIESDDDSTKKFDLFISYAHADDRGESLDKVKQLVAILRADYQRVTGTPLNDFFDLDHIRTMDAWAERILLGLRQSKMMVAILSPAYFQSAYCRKEWEYYVETELAHSLPGEGIAPIYIIKHPDYDQGRLDQDLHLWADNLKKRQYLNWVDYWPHGAVALEREDAQSKIDWLTGRIVERLGRAARLAVNHHVPRPSQYFVGRRDELHRLRQMMLDGHIGAITAVEGIAGIGKSTLAFAYAWGYGFEYPGGRFLIAAENQTDLAGRMIDLATPKGVELTELERQRPELALIRVKKAFEDGPQALLVIDNLDDPRLLGPQSLARFLPRGEHIHVLVTTRTSPEGVPRVACLPLDSLTSTDGLALLNQFQPISDDEWKAALEIVNRLAGHALAIEVVGVYLRMKQGKISYRFFAESLKKDGISMLDDKVGPQVPEEAKWHKQSCIAKLLEPTLAALRDEERRTLEYAAQLPADTIPIPWLQELIQADFPDLPAVAIDYDLTTLFAKLEKLRLVIPTSTEPGAEKNLARMHRLVQEIVSHRIGIEEDSERWEAVASLAVRRRKWIKENWGPLGLKWELTPLLEMALRLMDRGDSRGALFAYDIADPLIHQGRSFEARNLWERGQTFFVKRLEADPDSEWDARELAACHERLGNLAVAEGDGNTARKAYQDSLEIRERLSRNSPENAQYARDVAVSLSNFATLLDNANDPTAREGWRRVWDAFQAMKRRGMQLSHSDEQWLKWLGEHHGFAE